MIICEKCGTKNIFDGATVCKKCLAPLHKDKKPERQDLPLEQSTTHSHSYKENRVKETSDLTGEAKKSDISEKKTASDDDTEFEIKEVESGSGSESMFLNSDGSSEESGLIRESSTDSEPDLITPEPIEKELTLYRDDELQVVMEETENGPAITLTDMSDNQTPPDLKPLVPTGESEKDEIPPELSEEELQMDKSEETNVTQKIIINPIVEKKPLADEYEKKPGGQELSKESPSPQGQRPDRRPSEEMPQPVSKTPEDNQANIESTAQDIEKKLTDKLPEPQTPPSISEPLAKQRGIAYVSGNTIKLTGGVKASVGDEITIGDKVIELKEKPPNKIPLYAGIGGGILFLFLLLIIFSSGKAPSKGQIVGILKNPESGELIVGATVKIKELGKSTRTNNAGFFIFDLIPPDIYTVEAQVPYPLEDEKSGLLSERISVIKNRTSAVSFSIPVYGIPVTDEFESREYSQPEMLQEIQTPPKAKYGFLKLKLSPSKAKAYLDGKYIGKGSQTFKVPAGKHKVTVKHNGYKNLTKKVNIKDDQMLSDSFKLTKERVARKAPEKTDEELATELEETGQYSQALTIYNKVLEKEDENIEALMGSARCYYAKGDKDNALSAYLKAARIAGDRKDKPTQLGALSGVLEINPNYLTARYTRGSIYLNQGEYYRAAKDFSKVIEIDPRHLNAHYKLGEAYFKSKNYPAAIQTYQQTQNLNFADTKPYAYMAEAYLAMGDTKNAKKYYKKFEKNADLATKNRFESDPEWQKVKQVLEK